MKFIVFLVSMAFGLLFILKTDTVIGFTGRNAWAERTFGGGGTYTFLKLLGAGVIIFGMAYATGAIDSAIGGVSGSVFGGLKQ